MPFYVQVTAYAIVSILIGYFIRVDVIENRQLQQRNTQLKAEVDFCKRQIGTMRGNSLVTFNERTASRKDLAA